ncbi:hypothetical protein FKW77_005516 [Venturia effusa]|uniref:AAA+ ATPase domain-containing protein n=1 Tax=Venturia effusa TaxID=50376 RepID=A0A517LMU5_9PEZI|nr:hypothetical protein FKW77_005516 [Venturia effusa]
MEYQTTVDCVCPAKHKTKKPCFKSQAACTICVAEEKQRERIRRRNEHLDTERDTKRAAYAQQLAEAQAEIDHHKRRLKDSREAEDLQNNLEQRMAQLSNLKETTKKLDEKKQSESEPKSAEKPKSSRRAVASEDDDEGDRSSAKKQWEHFKRSESAENEALDTLMDMIGLEEVKDNFLSFKLEVDTAIRQELDMSNKRFGCSMLGNPGTGKTTVARLYAKFLTSVGALPGNHFIETTGAALANDGVSGCKKVLEEIQENGAHFGGSAVLDFILAEVENLTGKVVFTLAGYNKQMEKFFAHNPGFPSRFPHELQFKDYEDSELLKIFVQKMDKRYKDRMEIEGGVDGLFARIVARRVGRGRGREGFGNAREMENTLSKIASRQAVRIAKERRAGKKPDDFLFTSADLLGPEPTEALNNSRAWKQLQSLIGLAAVKKAVEALFVTVKLNYQRELAEAPLVEYSLNKVFLGSPGTGKTTVAKMYGQILADLGFLSNGEVVVKNPSDFVGNFLGASESTTKGILASTVGKVLLIDEAYGLCGSMGNSGGSDPYKAAVIDTIVAEVQSVPGDDRCVLLAGYKEQMEEMFQVVNPGLSRRFPLASAFVFEDFDDDDISKIFDLKLKKLAFKTTTLGKTAMEVLRRARNRPNFGNAGEVDILLDHAKARQQQRLNDGNGTDRSRFEPTDFDEDFDRGERADTNVRLLFRDDIGCEAIISQLEGYQNAVRELKAMDMDPREEIPFNFLFRGPPGTGKTTTARKMGKVFYDMGFLAKAEVVECSATELIGEFVGQTGPKVQKVLENALGRVLSVDEAYRLADGPYAKEAMDEVVDCLTKPRFAQKLVVILAGYDNDINRLMAQNPGLTSRFPEALVFAGLEPEHCWDLLVQCLRRRQKEMKKKQKELNLSAIENPTTAFKQRVLGHFDALRNIANWANARDVQTIAKHTFGILLKSGAMKNATVPLAEDTLLTALESMISERGQRQDTGQNQLGSSHGEGLAQMQNRQAPPPPSLATTRDIVTAAPRADNPSKLADQPSTETTASEVQRDSGVSDAVWDQLQRDKQATQLREEQYQQLLKSKTDSEKDIGLLQQKEADYERQFQQAVQQNQDQTEIQEAKRLREEARL